MKIIRVRGGWPEPEPSSADVVELRPADWNDWYEFRTLFFVSYIDSELRRTFLGAIKIGKIGFSYSNMNGAETPFDDVDRPLDDSYVAVAQDESLYLNALAILGRASSMQLFGWLRDLALEPARLDQVRNERVVSESLFRSVSSTTVVTTFARTLLGEHTRLAFNLRYQRPQTSLVESPLMLEFKVDSSSRPPSNIHVVTGRNGSGKTSLLQAMARSLLGAPFARDGDGQFISLVGDNAASIANLVYVGFSAFDAMDVPVRASPMAYQLPYTYIGLIKLANESGEAVYEARAAESPDAKKVTSTADGLATYFAKSAWAVVNGKSIDLWKAALTVLESDPNFASEQVAYSLAGERAESSQYLKDAIELYKKLSSGHKIILLTITRLVETVADRSLVLMDEPEGHLHPPLLSAFVRALSELLRARNGLAVIATHSPVILQEVPRTNAYSLVRHGGSIRAEPPSRETFGENVGVLTHSVFGLEAVASGYSSLLLDAAVEHRDYKRALASFGDQLGLEGRALLQIWLSNPDPSSVARLIEGQ